MVKIYQRTLKEGKLREVEELKAGSWVDAVDPSDEEVEVLTKQMGLEADLVRDAVDPFEVPRLEVEGEAVYAFARTAHKLEEEIVTVPVLVAVSGENVITVSKKELPFMERLREGRPALYTTQKTRLLIQIFFQILGSYSDLLNDINRQVRRIGVNPEKTRERDVLRFVRFEETLNTFVADLLPMGRILKELLSGKNLKLYEEDKDLVEDLLLSTEQLVEVCKSNLRSIVNIREGYSAVVTNKLNRVIRILTVWTIILTIPTIVASLYGMNVSLPGAQSPWAFWGIAGVTVGVSLGLLGFFIHKEWL